MCPPRTICGIDIFGGDDSGKIILFAARELRKKGFVIPVIPDDHEKEKETNEESGTPAKRRKLDQKGQDPELEYIKKNFFEKFEVRDNKGACVAELTTGADAWLIVRCFTPAVLESIEVTLKKSWFYVSKIQHESKQLPFRKSSYKVVVVTGGELDALSSKFTVTKGDKEVAKALLSYHNGEMGSIGPTLELFEVAKKWRRHGLGSLLMKTITKFLLTDAFKNAKVRNQVHFSVCYVTNRHASEWFQRHHHFHDLDGMGEELGKPLVPK
eukprot:m.48364 g.48364  ORF g.48364 m.48364 type:complete len:269 (-) comp20717_c0_seq1:60-866(-)